MFRSNLLEKFNIERKILDNSHNYFYLSQKFRLLKEHIKYQNNYSLKIFQIHDIMKSIDLGLTTNPEAANTMIRYFIYILKRDIYSLNKFELSELKDILEVIIEKHKYNDLNESKSFFIKHLEEILSIVEQLIKI